MSKIKEFKEVGPWGWFGPEIEAAYSKMKPREPVKKITKLPKKKKKVKKGIFESLFQEGQGEEVLNHVKSNFWEQRLREFQLRKASVYQKETAKVSTMAVGMPAIPSINNWIPIGPSVVARGQAVGSPSVGGRIPGLAIAPGGNRMYAASASGGVFRSDDGGNSWASTMDGFDVDPNNFASASLVCGAIAISPADPDRVYVGTGEGDTDALFSRRLTNALPSYRGIGPIRSDDGGNNWISENSSPSLAGMAFFQLAVDPGNVENVIGATTNGLYQRTTGASGPLWQRRRTGNHCSVVVTRSGSTTTFYAARWGGPVYSSTNGSSWSTVGTGFPSSNVGRIALGVQPDNPNVLYAFVADSDGNVRGLYRLDGGSGSWKNISGVPNVLPGGQGDFDLCIAVDPNNVNRVYLGGDRGFAPPWPGNISRCSITSSSGNYSISSTSIGDNAHADVHVLMFVPGDSNRLWTGTDGGCFLNSSPSGAGAFEGRNTGLSCLLTNFIGMSPSEPAIIYSGLQDNGSARYLGEEMWIRVTGGDGGYTVVHPTNPFEALTFANGTVFRTSDGGQSWSVAISPPWVVMTEPLVGAPNSERVAFGAGRNIYVSNDFGTTWPSTASPNVTLPAGTSIYSMVFASSTRLFIGTTDGRVYQSDLSGGTWSLSRLDNVVAGPLVINGLISDIAIDWSDSSLQSIYICYGGIGDTRHVWRFDGTRWQSRSGSGPNTLLDIEHNAIVVDPTNSTVYVGADIGVWRSVDSGNNWEPMQNGLPDAPVFDLQIHNGARLLRASTHGRGLYEFRLDPPVLGGSELFIRDTYLDTARGENTDGRDDPSIWPTRQVAHWRSPNIKVDMPTTLGYQTPTNQIDFFQFHETLVDGSRNVATIDPPAIVNNRVYVLVHNRGPFTNSFVRVMAAITNASTVLNPLPVGYTSNVQSETPLPGSDWTTLGPVTLTDLRPGFPQVAAFDLPSNLLPLPASLPGQSHFCLMAFVHSSDDPFTATQRNVDLLTISERKVAQKNLHVVQFVGTPPPSSSIGMWIKLDITGFAFKKSGFIDLIFNLKQFDGKLSIVAPKQLLPSQKKHSKDFTVHGNSLVKKWFKKYSKYLERLCWEGNYDRNEYIKMIKAMKLVSVSPILRPRKTKSRVAIISRLKIRPKDRHTIFVRIDPPKDAKIGQSWEFSITQRDSRTGRIQGGADYIVRINRPVKKQRPTKPKLLPISKLKSKLKGGGGALRLKDSRRTLVRDLQKILVYLGFSLGKYGPKKDGVDGVFGKVTQRAVIKFQRNNIDENGKRLDVDGLVGPLTGGALNQAVKEA